MPLPVKLRDVGDEAEDEEQRPLKLAPREELVVEEADDIAQGECWPVEAFEFVDPAELLLLLFVCDVGEVGLFFHGWKPLPTAASAKGGGDLLLNLLH